MRPARGGKPTVRPRREAAIGGPLDEVYPRIPRAEIGDAVVRARVINDHHFSAVRHPPRRGECVETGGQRSRVFQLTMMTESGQGMALMLPPLLARD